MAVVVFGVDHNECNLSKGFLREFNTAVDADIYIQTQCNRIKREEINQYGIYIGNEFTTIDEVLHMHYCIGTNSKYEEVNKKLHRIDIAAIKTYIDIEYANYLKRQIQRRQETTNRVNNMDAAAIEYHKQLFNEMKVNFF